MRRYISGLSRQETATIIAALRYWQEDQVNPSTIRGRSAELMAISTGGESFENLSAEEIDKLCEGLNH